MPKCIESVINQTYKNLEIILVDDGSPDNCGKICDEYAKKDDRIKVIHKENGGAPSARNAGIKIATGEYFYFPDSDDWLEKDYLEKLYHMTKNNFADVVISGFIQEYFENNQNLTYSLIPEKKVFKKKEEIRKNIHNYFDNMMIAVPWNKLYNASYIKDNKLEFPNLKWDDLHFNMEVLRNASSICICPYDGYHFFRSRPGSETNKVFDKMLYIKRKEQFEHILNVYNDWNCIDEDISKILYGYYAGRLVQCIQEISISDSKNKRELIREIFNDDLTKIAFKKGNIKSKILRFASIPMKLQNITLSIFFGKSIGFVKKKFPQIFYKLKSKSINKAK